MTITETEARERLLDAISFTETANMGTTPETLLNDYQDAILRGASTVTGSTSDGFHTFDELYHHRTILTAMLLHQLPGLDPWKARLHDDGTMFDGFFIVGADTMGGQATYHCRNQYWDLFDIEELERAPAFDGHTPDDTLSRLFLDIMGRELKVKP